MASLTRLFWRSKVLKDSIPVSSFTIQLRRNLQGQGHHFESTEKATQPVFLHTYCSGDSSHPQVQLFNLPKTCPGCGAYTQNLNPSAPGFFSARRKAVKNFVTQETHITKGREYQESQTFDKVLENADRSLLSQLGFSDQKIDPQQDNNGGDRSTPVCDRCHRLTHHNTGASIAHPTLQSIHATISRSPYKYNHVYHVIDAADFPLSLIPLLQKNLSLNPQRSINRRAKSTRFKYGRRSEMSYIITRSDLLAPQKEQVDNLMPYFVQVLRNALGGSARNVRLGNVRCVSSKRGWWTRALKKDIYSRGGGGWMVGKVNVGKSNLFQHVFPKGYTQDVAFGSERNEAQDCKKPSPVTLMAPLHRELKHARGRSDDENLIPHESLLPPLPKETPYPTLPLVSSSPGTTASPIRLSYGSGKGELIDLPGLERGGLEAFVAEDHKQDLVMHRRIKAKQFTIKSGQSLTVGGLIQITPVTPEMTILAYPFLPLQCHVSSVEKARSIMIGDVGSGLSTIVKPGLGHRMHSAGMFPLNWDVTKERAGPLTAKDGAGLKTRVLPFVVLSTDILIEGCGWIELVAQVRKKDFLESEETQTKSFFDNKVYPMVEVVSPDGRHVGSRRPMGAWLLGVKTLGAIGRKNKRPRRSMKGAKKALKRYDLARSHE